MPSYTSVPAPIDTIWGVPDTKDQVLPGIWHVTTPSHGGYVLSDERQAAMPAALRRDDPFYEEDVDWALVLLGFSQGAMMALHAGLRLPHPPAAILAYAGALLDPEGLERELVRPPPPVLLVHGEVDPVVPAEASRRAALRLRQFGVPVEALFEPGVDHTISPEGMMAGAAFLRRCMKPS